MEVGCWGLGLRGCGMQDVGWELGVGGWGLRVEGLRVEG